MRNLFMVGGVLFGGLLMAPTTIPDPRVPASRYRRDPRLARLERFFRAYGCPASELAEDFLVAADRHGLDWRLLPSIAFVESTGGKYCSRNNILGWGSARTGFPNVRSGIHRVAERLERSKYYRYKGLAKILYTYNPRANYPARVMRVMAEIGPAGPSVTQAAD